MNVIYKESQQRFHRYWKSLRADLPSSNKDTAVRTGWTPLPEPEELRRRNPDPRPWGDHR
jgi:hypothetical protein